MEGQIAYLLDILILQVILVINKKTLMMIPACRESGRSVINRMGEAPSRNSPPPIVSP